VRVERQAAADLDVPVLHEVLGLAARAEAELLELYQHERGEVVVEDRGADVARPEAGHLPELPGDDAGLRQTVPRPLAFTASAASERQAGHIGLGGCRSRPHSVQRWIRSSPRRTPSQKKRLSRWMPGRGRISRDRRPGQLSSAEAS
jgi:hypothetical protein